MKRIIFSLCVIAVFTFYFAQVTWADELSELKAQMKAMQRQMQIQLDQIKEQQKTMEAMKERISILEMAEAKKAPQGIQDMEIGYKKGFYIKSIDDAYSLRFRFLLQPQYEYLSIEDGEDTNTFLIKRAQLRLLGNIFDPRLKYKMMLQGTTTSSGSDELSLRDLWIDWQWKKYFQIMVGQFFVYYDYENLQPSWALPLVDRSIINANLGFERDIGVQLHGNLFSDRLNYHLYMMNGDGRNTLNTNDEFFYGARLGCHILGTQQYLLSDIETSNSPHLTLGASFLHDTGKASLNDNRLNRFTTDLAFRYKGFSALSLVNFVRNENKDVTDYGLLGQAGYFIIPERLELAGRWAKVIKDGALGTNTVDPHEFSFGLNYYIKGHNAKLQVDYSRLLNNASTQDRDDDRVRLQLQLFF